MDKTEEVKKILSKFREAIETEDNDFHYDAQLEAERQICQLFGPKHSGQAKFKTAFADELMK